VISWSGCLILFTERKEEENGMNIFTKEEFEKKKKTGRKMGLEQSGVVNWEDDSRLALVRVSSISISSSWR